jgi:hypothetical protein
MVSPPVSYTRCLVHCVCACRQGPCVHDPVQLLRQWFCCSLTTVLHVFLRDLQTGRACMFLYNTYSCYRGVPAFVLFPDALLHCTVTVVQLQADISLACLFVCCRQGPRVHGPVQHIQLRCGLAGRGGSGGGADERHLRRWHSKVGQSLARSRLHAAVLHVRAVSSWLPQLK